MDVPYDDECGERLQQKTATVLLLCGLPGSGKSTLATFLLENNNSPRERWIHFEYDELARQLQHQQQSKDPFQLSSEALFLEEIECLSDDAGDDEQDKTWLLAWRQSRTEALHLFRKELEQHFVSQNDSVKSNPNNAECQHLIVIMDDNFFLRSMRRDVYKVCQRVTAALTPGLDANCQQAHPVAQSPRRRIYFGIILVNTSLKVCLTRNRQRLKDRVSDETIIKMNHRLEPPNPNKYEFEKHSLHLHGSDDLDEADQTNLVSKVLNFVYACRQSAHVPIPQPSPAVEAARVTEERRKTFESLLHSYDKILRGWVGQVAQMERSAAGAANASRQKLMQLLRQQRPREDGVPQITTLPELFESFWEGTVVVSSTLQAWSQEQKDELRRRVLT